ncbi:MAG: 2OG-Fe(II) oxygenase family protein [Gammaproteobacteria bacterium]|nr:2OG-Fe(II) oxygenase family protein [Gammaproteobacteria bacterium]MDH3372927.1 2OG-Fe(II) oxygenase family protein [Gammaproteobacteria bacterium]MDH3409572.1 2OG-Fe(II) oxygenase family protein [Gammaproteobacteria bacterium]MDH3552015.1 2OG-Fe(II) oxygenase family protein [Gammaproteobacteria bacterium]
MSQNYQLHTVFPSCLYVAEVENAAQINKAMLPYIYEMREQDRANIKDPEMLSVFENEVWSTYFSHPGIGLLKEPWTQELQRAILENTEQLVNLLQLDFGKRKPRVTTLFANIHEELYHRHDAHTHPGSMFSGSYFVKTYPGAGRFRLINPCRALQFHEFKFREDNELNVNEVSLDPVAGRLVMFQSHVPHAVDRPTARGERVAIAFNVNYE